MNASKQDDREQTLPPVVDGEMATIIDVRVLQKKTKPPARFTEGTLIEEMKGASKHVEDAVLRAALKQVSGLGTSATRDSIIETLKSHKYLTISGKNIVPTEKGEALVLWLDEHCSELADIALTARWEAQLDVIATQGGGAKFEADVVARVRDIVATLQHAAPIGGAATENKTKMTEQSEATPKNKPTDKMLNFAKKLAEQLGLELPAEVSESFEGCKAFLDAHAQTVTSPTQKQIDFAKSIAQRKNIQVPEKVRNDKRLLSKWIDENK